MRTQILLLLVSLVGIVPCDAAGKDPAVVLYTPYTKISVPPGQSIDYTIDIINNTEAVKNVAITLKGIPKDWHYQLKSGGWSISELSVLPGEKKNISLSVEVPFKVKKGTYRFAVNAPGLVSLPLTVIVSEEGTFKTEFTTKQPNMEGASKTSFTFSAELKNYTAEKQMYSFRHNAPRGWNVFFKVSGRQVSSAQVEPNQTESVTIEIDPPDAIAAGSYKIPVSALSSSTSGNMELEVSITGSYSLELTTPTGLLSADITAGDEKRISLLVKNNGSAELTNVKMNASTPVNWEVTFEPKEIASIKPGAETEVSAIIKADKRAIAGDYITTIDAKVPEVSSSASFRISVETPMLYGWIGVLIIGGATSGLYYLFRRYGRR